MFICDKTWASQDLAMAKTLRSYGFTGVYRAWEHKLMAAFDNGPYVYEIPWICFLQLQPGETATIDELIGDSEEEKANMAKRLKEHCEDTKCSACQFLTQQKNCAFIYEPCALEV